MALPTDRTTLKRWVRAQADENYQPDASGPFAGEEKLEAIIDTVFLEHSSVKPLIAEGEITISGRYAVLPDDPLWIDGHEWNTKLLFALQRGRDPSLLDLEQGSDVSYQDGDPWRSSTAYSTNGYGYGTGGSVIQNPVAPGGPRYEMPHSSKALIDGVQKKVFVLPVGKFGDGSSFTVRYCAVHVVRDAVGEDEDLVPALITIDGADLPDICDRIFDRAIKGRIFKALRANEVAGSDKRDIGKMKDMTNQSGLAKKYPR